MKSMWVRTAIVTATALVVAGGSLAAYGYVFGFDDAPTVAGASNTTPGTPTSGSTTTVPPTTAAPTTTVPPTTTTHPPMKEPPAKAMPAVPGNGLGQYSSGPAVTAFEQRLKDLHFDPGPVDGKFDLNTRYAVEAVQKLWNLPRTGRIDENTRTVIAGFKWPRPLVPKGEANRVEIDLDHQVLIVWTDWKIKLITTTSTGSGRRFCGGNDGCQYAVTPSGKYEFTWHKSGWRDGALGMLWNPYYFNGGIAVHGYKSVPTVPASHGCARIPMDIATYFATLVTKGEPVYVVGTPAAKTGTAASGNTGTTPRTTTTTAPPATTPSTVPPKPTSTTTTKPKPSTTTTPPTTAHATTTT